MQKEENHINKIEIANLARRQKKVSVCMITYNHEKFISQAIEGVLMQETDFDFELVIGEDFSTDTTRAICEQYANKYPKIIRLLSSDRNLGSMQNFIRTINECKGAYIALCEGDDYWTAKNKLKLQVDFLDFNIDYVCCVTESMMDFDTYQKKYTDINFTFDLKREGILSDSYYATNTFVYRSNIIEMGQIFEESLLGDSLLLYLLSLRGKIKYLPNITGAYRKHIGGIFTGTDGIVILKRQLLFYEILIKHGYLKDMKIINKLIGDFKIQIAYQHMYRGEKYLAFKYMKQVNMNIILRNWKTSIKCLGHFLIK